MDPRKGELLPDTEQGLIAKAFEKNYSIIASYSIIPISPHITLNIHERGQSTAHEWGQGV